MTHSVKGRSQIYKDSVHLMAVPIRHITAPVVWLDSDSTNIPFVRTSKSPGMLPTHIFYVASNLTVYHLSIFVPRIYWISLLNFKRSFSWPPGELIIVIFSWNLRQYLSISHKTIHNRYIIFIFCQFTSFILFLRNIAKWASPETYQSSQPESEH